MVYLGRHIAFDKDGQPVAALTLVQIFLIPEVCSCNFIPFDIRHTSHAYTVLVTMIVEMHSRDVTCMPLR